MIRLAFFDFKNPQKAAAKLNKAHLNEFSLHDIGGQLE